MRTNVQARGCAAVQDVKIDLCDDRWTTYHQPTMNRLSRDRESKPVTIGNGYLFCKVEGNGHESNTASHLKEVDGLSTPFPLRHDSLEQIQRITKFLQPVCFYTKAYNLPNLDHKR